MPPGSTAVVIDEWPLVRMGIVQALRAVDVRVVAETASGEEGLRRLLQEQATFLLVGSVRDAALADVVRRAVHADPPARVLVFLDHVGRDDLAAVATEGADALLVRSGSPDDVADAITRVRRGERVVAPMLVPVLVGVLGSADDDAGDGVLTRKEREVLFRLAQGLSNREIADALYITPATVKTHLAHIYTKLGVAGRQEALAKAVTLGLLN